MHCICLTFAVDTDLVEYSVDPNQCLADNEKDIISTFQSRHPIRFVCTDHITAPFHNFPSDFITLQKRGGVSCTI